jgi:hypothetical protein
MAKAKKSITKPTKEAAPKAISPRAKRNRKPRKQKAGEQNEQART